MAVDNVGIQQFNLRSLAEHRWEVGEAPAGTRHHDAGVPDGGAWTRLVFVVVFAIQFLFLLQHQKAKILILKTFPR